jgi:hypothetical protein
MSRRKINRAEIPARLQLIGQTLKLSRSEVDKATRSDELLIEFADRHNQSLDWILRGDMRLMIWAMRELNAAGRA